MSRLARDPQESPQPPTVEKVRYHSAQVRGADLSQVLRQSNFLTVVDANNVIMRMFRLYESLDVIRRCVQVCIFVVYGRG